MHRDQALGSRKCHFLCFSLACVQGLRGALAAGREKKGELATTPLEFEYLHCESRCEMLIGENDISNDVITLSSCFSMFIYIRSRFVVRKTIHMIPWKYLNKKRT